MKKVRRNAVIGQGVGRLCDTVQTRLDKIWQDKIDDAVKAERERIRKKLDRGCRCLCLGWRANALL